MNEKKTSVTASVIYAIIGFALVAFFTISAKKAPPLTVQTAEQGFKGLITIETTFSNGKITAAKLVSSEDSDFTKPAIETVLAQAVKTGKADKLDTVSGATFSSKATIAALQAAEKKAVEHGAIKAR